MLGGALWYSTALHVLSSISPPDPDDFPALRPRLLLPELLRAAAHLSPVPQGHRPAHPHLPQLLGAGPRRMRLPRTTAAARARADAPLLLHVGVRHLHHDQRCPPPARPGLAAAACRSLGVPRVPHGCSASTLGSFFTCIPSSCLPLPAQRPLAWEHWGMEAGAPVAPLCCGCICLRRCPSLSRDTSVPALKLFPAGAGRCRAPALRTVPGGGRTSHRRC